MKERVNVILLLHVVLCCCSHCVCVCVGGGGSCLVLVYVSHALQSLNRKRELVALVLLTLCLLGNFSCFFCSLLFFFKSNYFEKFFRENSKTCLKRPLKKIDKTKV